MARQYDRELGGTHLILNATDAALLRRLAEAEERSLQAVVRRALATYAALQSAQQ